MAIEQFDTDTEIHINLSQSAQIMDVEDISKHLTKTLESKVQLVIFDLSLIEQVDVSFFQLLLSYNLSLVKSGRHMVIKALPDSHIVMQRSRLVGITLSHHITFVGATK